MTTMMADPGRATQIFSPDARSPKSTSSIDTRFIVERIRRLKSEAGIGWSEIGAFLALDFLIISAILLLVLIARSRNPDATWWSAHFVTQWRAIALSTILIIGAGAVGFALFSAWTRHRNRVLTSLALSAASAVAFLIIQGLDYDHRLYNGLAPGDQFRPRQRFIAQQFGVKLPKKSELLALATTVEERPKQRLVDAKNGERLFLGTCASCHGKQGEGMPGSGKDLRLSEFAKSTSDADLLKFVIKGRQPWEPENVTKVAMPGRGGNPMLSDADLRDCIAFVRVLQNSPTIVASTPAPSATSPPEAGATAPVAVEIPLDMPRWILSEGEQPASVLTPDAYASITRPVWKAPHGASATMSMYFATNGIFSVHVLFLLPFIVALLWKGVANPAARLDGHLLISAIGWCWVVGCWFAAYPLTFM